MSTRIGLISDIHATPGPLAEALNIFANEGLETILCAGDIAGYGPDLASTIDLLERTGCRAILGNHDLWRLTEADPAPAGPIERYLRRLPLVDEMVAEGTRILVVHGSPPGSLMEGIKLLDEEGEMIPEARAFWEERLAASRADVLVVGHTHQVFAERLGGLLVVNPGSTKFNHSCAVLDLPERTVEFFSLGGLEIEPAWNWGMQFREDD